MRASRSITRGLAVATSLGLAFALSSCKEEPVSPPAGGGDGAGGGNPATPAPAPVAVASVDGLNIVTGSGRSKHFDAVASHLNLGGTVFGYVDIDGDVEKLAGLVQGMIDKIPDEEKPPHIKKLDLAKVLSELGLDGIEAIGMSSNKNGEMYHNRAFVYVPEGRKGLLKAFGGDAGAFVSKSLAPADSDFVVEQTINIRAAYDVISAMVMRIGGPEASKEFQAEMGRVNPQFGLSMAEILGRVETRLTMVARVHPDKPLDIPDAPMEIPSFDFLIALDDLDWLYEKITTKMKAEMPEGQAAEMFVNGDGFEKIALPPMPPDMPIMQPVIYKDVATKRVLAASSQAFLDECLSGKTKLADSADFKTAMAGLPSEGNGLSYVSTNLMKTGRGMYEGLLGAGAESGIGMQETLIIGLLSAAIPDNEAAQGKVVVNQKDGLFVSSNSTASMKEGLITSSASLMATFTGLAWSRSAASPAFDGDILIEERAIEVSPAPAIPERE